MSNYKFTLAQRFAVFTVHGERCYICKEPIDFTSMEVDHIVPESLLRNKTKLDEALVALGRPGNFDLNSYENWLPTCRRCNGLKLNTLLDVSPLVQLQLQKAAAKADLAKQMEKKNVSDKEVAHALYILQRAKDSGTLNERIIASLTPLLKASESYREPEMIKKLLHLAPLFSVISEGNGIRVVKGPYGVGAGSTNPYAPSCPSCGYKAWNGTRCVMCGEMSDD